jgi:UDP-N-acetylmuramate: L-alanyl-gamma-D-glutamyl-meso-diaminopimelate ligase
VKSENFYEGISTFKGAAKRLELIAESPGTVVYKDFAHAPSKLKATIEAVKQQYPHLALTACMELHTFSSLSENFLDQYKNTMDKADEAIVYFNPLTAEHKKLKPIVLEQIVSAFERKDLKVFNDSKQMRNYLLEKSWENKSLLLMSSGNFGGLDLDEIGESIVKVNTETLRRHS